MYLNLKAEIVRRNTSNKKLAMKIGITERSLRNKISGKSEFTMKEALEIKKSLQTDIRLEELFSKYETESK